MAETYGEESPKTRTQGLVLDSDGEMASEAMNTSKRQSSTSSNGSFSRRISFAAAAAAVTSSPSPSSCFRPHRSSDTAWAAIRSHAVRQLGPKDFKILRRVGSGDIGNVYLCRLRENEPSSSSSFSSSSSSQLFAMKVVDRNVLAKKKLGRAEAERRILRTLDHPFLPTLYADFDASPNHSCVVIEFCAGGDLHSLRHRQPGRRFPLLAARFYAAEVLLALEYLHLLGIVYRDLKPENVLIRSDGHVMLSDFDLSLESSTCPTLERSDDDHNDIRRQSFCFPGRRRRLHPADLPPARFIAEPLVARSRSFVGTHEYVSPEVASGRAHGSAVDWWALGIFLYELLYGRTPFAGPTNEATLRNIVKKPLDFPPQNPPSITGDAAARDLIAALLVKDPASRLGSRGGAADIKSHAFFKRLKFALLRSQPPPFVPGPNRSRSSPPGQPDPSRFDYF